MSDLWPNLTGYPVSPSGIFQWVNAATNYYFGIVWTIAFFVFILFVELYNGFDFRSSVLGAGFVTMLMGLALYWMGALQGTVLLVLAGIIAFAWLWQG